MAAGLWSFISIADLTFTSYLLKIKRAEKGYIFLYIKIYDVNIATEAIYDSNTSYREKWFFESIANDCMIVALTFPHFQWATDKSFAQILGNFKGSFLI